MKSILNLEALLKQAMEADVTALRQFLTTNPGQPLVATGSGGAESVADFAALLYGARGGIATAVSPYTLNTYSDEALKTSKLLLVSKGGHNNDIVFAAKRGLAVNPAGTASFTLYPGDRNEVRKAFVKAGSAQAFDIPGLSVHDAFISTQTPVMYFALLCRVFAPSEPRKCRIDWCGMTAPRSPRKTSKRSGVSSSCTAPGVALWRRTWKESLSKAASHRPVWSISGITATAVSSSHRHIWKTRPS